MLRGKVQYLTSVQATDLLNRYNNLFTSQLREYENVIQGCKKFSAGSLDDAEELSVSPYEAVMQNNTLKISTIKYYIFLKNVISLLKSIEANQNVFKRVFYLVNEDKPSALIETNVEEGIKDFLLPSYDTNNFIPKKAKLVVLNSNILKSCNVNEYLNGSCQFDHYIQNFISEVELMHFRNTNISEKWIPLCFGLCCSLGVGLYAVNANASWYMMEILNLNTIKLSKLAATILFTLGSVTLMYLENENLKKVGNFKTLPTTYNVLKNATLLMTSMTTLFGSVGYYLSL